jgi:hypothetical protein
MITLEKLTALQRRQRDSYNAAFERIKLQSEWLFHSFGLHETSGAASESAHSGGVLYVPSAITLRPLTIEDQKYFLHAPKRNDTHAFPFSASTAAAASLIVENKGRLWH